MKVSIVIPHYNGYAMLSKCLDAIRMQTFKDFETIVVDNASSDGSAKFVSENYPEIILIENSENKGFDGAVNQGILYSKADYVLLLNNDTVIFPDFLEKITAYIDKDDKIFAVSSHMLKVYKDCATDGSYSMDELSNDNCGDLYTILGWALTKGSGKKASKYMKQSYIFSACAGAALYNRKYFEKTGRFDETFFAYREDIDVCHRAKIMGYKICYAPDALVYHLGSATTGSKYNNFKLFHGTRNTIYMNYKNFPTIFHIINSPFFLVGHIIKFLYFCFKGFGLQYLKGLFAGFKDIFSGKVKKNPFYMRFLFNYLKIEWELIINCIRVFI